MHAGMLQIANDETGKNEKMSKSLNNFILLHEALEQVQPNVLRMLVLQTHYRSALVFGEKRVAEAKTALSRIETAIKNIDWKVKNIASASSIDSDKLISANEKAKEKFVEAMDDDFNTSLALAEIFELVGVINSQLANSEVDENTKRAVLQTKDTISELLCVFGIELTADKKDNSKLAEIAQQLGIDVATDAEQAILNVRAEARKNKN